MGMDTQPHRSTGQLPLILESSDVHVGGWRAIHYLGSKLRLLNQIGGVVEELVEDGAPVCDLFAGSGTVAHHLSVSNPVTAVDIQEYSRVICSALLNPPPIDIDDVKADLQGLKIQSENDGLLYAAEPLISYEHECLKLASSGNLEPICELIELGSLATLNVSPGSRLKSKKGEKALSESLSRLGRLGLDESPNTTAFRYFGGLYFSFEQSVELDLMLEVAARSCSSAQDAIKASVFSAASDVVNTVGKQFAQPLRPRSKDGTIKSSLYSLVSRDRYRSAIPAFCKLLKKISSMTPPALAHHAVKADYMDYLEGDGFSASLVYADPPYTRDHYSRYYHVLETLALRDNPEISNNKANGETLPSRGAYRVGRHQSPFCIKSQAPDAFGRMFKAVALKNVPLVLSYSPYASDKNTHPRVLTVDKIAKLAKTHFKNVDVRSAGQFSHSRLNKSELHKDGSAEAEFIFVCVP